MGQPHWPLGHAQETERTVSRPERRFFGLPAQAPAVGPVDLPFDNCRNIHTLSTFLEIIELD